MIARKIATLHLKLVTVKLVSGGILNIYKYERFHCNLHLTYFARLFLVHPFSTENKANEVKSECKSKSETANSNKVKDEIEFKVKSSNRGVKVKVEYKQEIDEGDTETESETQYEVVFDSVIEYIDGSGGENAAYDWESDEIVQEMDLDAWNDISEITESADGVTSMFSLTNPAGNVTFDFTISRATMSEHITANGIKIDFSLNDFPWKSEDSYVALLCSVETKREIEVEYDEDGDVAGETATTRASDIMINFADSVDTAEFTPFGRYTWAETADVETRSVSVDKNITGGLDNTTDIEISAQSVESAVPVVETVRVVATSPLVEPEKRRRRRQRRLSEEEDAEDEDGDGQEDDKEKDEKNEKKEDTKVEAETVEVRSVAFSFIGEAAHSAPKIFWDPEAGIGYTRSTPSGTVSIGIVTGLCSSLLALAVLF